MNRCFEDLLGRSGFHHFTRLHHHHLVSHGPDHVHIVGDEEIAQATFALQPQQQLDHLFLNGHVQRRSGFVEHQQLGLDDERSRNRHALALPTGKLVRIALQPGGKRFTRQVGQQPHLAQGLDDRTALSGAHLNPAVTLVQLITKAHTVRDSIAYVIAQIAGAITGAILANVMFDLPAVTFAAQERTSVGTLIGEVLATAGLIAIIGILSARSQAALIPVAVAAWIGSAYFFASSTSFANPAVTIGRMFSDTFAGIAPTSALPFIAAQLVGAALGVLVVSATNRATRTMSTQVNTKQE